MKKVIAAIATCAAFVPAVSYAAAIDDARERNICDVTDAEYLEDGRLKVVCVPGTVNPAYAGNVATPAVLGGTGLNQAAVAGAVAVVFLAIALGDDDSTTTTTTSP
ncbi:hypothetical protein ACFORG_02260 [Lutimaribacter marinistellae]|uniref:Uncharacterized protein n=1 Tax=Lutimaribacter marinistellae TaxID=1820329 RepID=A0ABV7TAD6_9RHOB